MDHNRPAMKNVMLSIQVGLYAVSLILSFCIFIPIIVHQSDFNGHCLLFSDGKWNTTGKLWVHWAPAFYCHFSIFVGVALLLACIYQLNRLGKHVWRGTDSTLFSTIVEAFGCILISLLVLCVSLLVTLGFKSWCDSITTRYRSCAGVNMKDASDNIYLPGFYFQMGTAQFGSWSCWVCCVGLTVCAFLKLCKFRESERIVITMARERERLLSQISPGPAKRSSNNGSITSVNSHTSSDSDPVIA